MVENTLPIPFVAFLSLTAVIFNTVAILAIRRTRSLSQNFKILLLNLAVADAGVGLISQPLNFAILIMEIENHHFKYLPELEKICNSTNNLLSVASFLGVTAIAADRFLAVYLHLRYEELVTNKRVASAVAAVWTVSVIIALLQEWEENIAFVIIATLFIICLIVIALFYFKLHLVVKYHTQQIMAQQIQCRENNDKLEWLNAERQKRSAIMIIYVYLALLICCLPTTILHTLYSVRIDSPPIFQFICDILFVLNSSLNPLIYWWKMKHIRHAAKAILGFWDPNRRKLSWKPYTIGKMFSWTKLIKNCYFLKSK